MAISVEEAEAAVTQLSRDQLIKFRAWFEKFDTEAWDKQIENDLEDGKLDDLANAAISEFQAGRSKRL